MVGNFRRRSTRKTHSWRYIGGFALPIALISCKDDVGRGDGGLRANTGEFNRY